MGVGSSYRPPAGVPRERPGRWSIAVSLVAHVLVLLFVLAPLVADHPRASAVARWAMVQGGTRGSSAGGSGARGASRERVQYVRVAASAPPHFLSPAPARVARPHRERHPATRVAARIRKPAHPALATHPVPHVTEKRPRSTAVPAIEPPAIALGTPAVAAAETLGTRGERAGGGGAAGDRSGTRGAGGGGGKGIAGARAAAQVPGAITPPVPDFVLIPVMPVPPSLRGKTVIVRFAVDETGAITRVHVATGDHAYDAALRARLMHDHFRPAHRADGTPVATGFSLPITF